LMEAIDYLVLDVDKLFIEIEKSQRFERVAYWAATGCGQNHDDAKGDKCVVELNWVIKFAQIVYLLRSFRQGIDDERLNRAQATAGGTSA